MKMRFLAGLVLAVSMALPAYAADLNLGSLQGKTCKGSYDSGKRDQAALVDTNMGAVWFEVSATDPSQVRFWRKAGQDALNNPAPAVRDADYTEIKGITALVIQQGVVNFSVPRPGTSLIFKWTLTPNGAPGGFIVHITGGPTGSTGWVTCT